VLLLPGLPGFPGSPRTWPVDPPRPEASESKFPGSLELLSVALLAPSSSVGAVGPVAASLAVVVDRSSPVGPGKASPVFRGRS